MLAALPLAFLPVSPAQLPATQATQQSAPAAPQQETPPPENSTYTLHVYTDLIQIPTLVLGTDLKPLTQISAEKFNISLDSGPLFHPRHVRIEGDDPIDLAILVDLSGRAASLQNSLSHAFYEFTTKSLQPHDHVSIYAVDCALIRTANDVAASDSDRLKIDFNNAINYPALHGAGGKKQHCSNSIRLWDTLAAIAQPISDEPGRRVILAITTGRDNKSIIKWEELRRYATSRSITIFGLYPLPEFGIQSFHVDIGTEDPFTGVTQNSGGMILFSTPLQVPLSLKRFIDLVRGRYILEFPRPDKGLPGEHSIDVTLTKKNAFIRPGGITVPLPDSALVSSPATVPSPPSPAAFGNRRPLDPHP